MKVPFLIGRILFGGFFLYNGINHFRQRKGLAQYAASKHVPAPEVGVVLSGALLSIGGTSVLLGLQPKWGAAAIVAFLASVSPVMHNFWQAEEPGARQNDMIHFSKNMAMLGAALAMLGMDEPWPMSVHQDKPGAPARVIEFARQKLAA